MTHGTMADHIRELTTHHTHREPRTYDNNGTTWTLDHITDHPPLITQLDQSAMVASGQDGELGSTTPGSKPAANLDALAAAAEIDLAAARWVRDLGEDDDLDTIACIRRLHGLSASASNCHRVKPERSDTGRITCCAWHAIEADVRRWWVRARVLSGWDSPAWKPDATCPLCGDWRTLVVRWSSSLATCSNCRETWDEVNIGLLADHIREESEAGRFTRPAPTPCGPADDVDEAPVRIMLCPDCGSRRCVKAQEQTVGRLVRHDRVG